MRVSIVGGEELKCGASEQYYKLIYYMEYGYSV